jgi:two-component system, NtrC family, C4-dicarboxylate transport response regulator DctD
MGNAVDSGYAWPNETPTALVIEDEVVIRRLIRRMLEPNVCRITEADCAEEGLHIVESGLPPVDVVLTDIRMPGLSGWDVIEVLARYCPALPVAAISAYGGGAAARAQSLGARLLPKPFTAAMLTGVVSTLIADARAMRVRAQAHRTHAEQARTSNELVHELHAGMRVRLDLVAAAWDLRRRLHLNSD